MKNRIKQVIKNDGKEFAYYTATAVLGAAVYTFVCSVQGYHMCKPVYSASDNSVVLETYMMRNLYDIRAFKK